MIAGIIGLFSHWKWPIPLSGASHSCLPHSFLLSGSVFAAQTFTIATYNVDTYLDQPVAIHAAACQNGPEAKAKVCDMIGAMNPDVIALEEMGIDQCVARSARLAQSEGRGFSPCGVHVDGADTNIHVAVLSKFPIVIQQNVRIAD